MVKLMQRVSNYVRELYFRAIVRFVSACVAYCRARDRVVQYEIPAFCKYKGEYGSLCPCGVCLGYQTGNVYMTRYVLFGHMTGDGLGAFEGRASRFWVKLKHYLPSLYVNCIHRNDHDEAVHNHPWPWAITFGLLGKYLENRVDVQEGALARHFGMPWAGLIGTLILRASPFCYLLKRGHWHRIASTVPSEAVKGHSGVWTLFLAAPRAFSQPWGYLIEGRGYVDQRERHAEIGARESRGEHMLLPLQGRQLDRVAQMYGLERKRYLWISESDKRLRARCIESAHSVLRGTGALGVDDRPAGMTRWQYWGLRLRMALRRAVGLPLWRKRGVS